MKKELLSIIIPTYNEEKVIKNCLDSLKKQSNKNTELIVVDDGSTDSTRKMVEHYAEITLLNQSHKGPAAARNLGAKHAKGEILIFVDSDMTFDQHFLQNLIKPIIEDGVKGTFSKEEFIGNWDNVWSRCWNYNRNFAEKKMHSDDQSDEGTDFRALVKTEFEKVNGFSDGGYTDSWSLFQKLGYKPKAAKGAIFYHNNPEQISEIFIQSKWMSKRNYKFGLIGILIALIRYSLPISLLVGIYKALKYKTWQFLLFKIVFDFAGFIGILERSILGKTSK